MEDAGMCLSKSWTGNKGKRLEKFSAAMPGSLFFPVSVKILLLVSLSVMGWQGAFHFIRLWKNEQLRPWNVPGRSCLKNRPPEYCTGKTDFYL